MNRLIEELILTGVGFKNEKVKIPVLMFAECLLIANYRQYEEAHPGCQ